MTTLCITWKVNFFFVVKFFWKTEKEMTKKLTHPKCFYIFVTLGKRYIFVNVMFTLDLRFTLQERSVVCVWAATSPSRVPTKPSTCAVSTTAWHRVCGWSIRVQGSRGIIQCHIMWAVRWEGGHEYGWSIGVLGSIGILKCDIIWEAGLLVLWGPGGRIQCDIVCAAGLWESWDPGLEYSVTSCVQLVY